MSALKDRFRNGFGVPLSLPFVMPRPLPYLRFELGDPDLTDAEYVESALRRCVSIHDRLFRPESSVCVYLRFWGGSPREQLRTLRRHGLRPTGGRAWQRERNDYRWSARRPTVRSWADFSAVVPARSSGWTALYHGVMAQEIGEWEGLSVQALVFDPRTTVAFYPYDDRGADVFGSEADQLRPAHAALKAWLLESDEERMREMLTGDTAKS